MLVERTVLGNGLTVLVHPDPSSDVVAIVTYVRAGYFDEPDDVVGVAHVVEHMFFKGTPRYGVGEIARATKSAGGSLNAHTIYDHTSYYTVLPARAFASGLDVQADAYANSLMDAAELARELEVIIQEAKRKADNPSAVSTETLYELLHDRHRMRRWRIGREDGLRRLTRAHVHGFYRNFYRPSNTILVIAGGVQPELALEEVERRYGGLEDAAPVRSPGPSEDGRREFRYRELSGDVTQSQLLFGWRAPPVTDPASPALELAATVLATGRASRLYRAVRERQLAAGVGATNYALEELGVFAVHLETDPSTTVEAARATWGEIMRLATDPVAPQELARARHIYQSRWLRPLETMEGRANYLAAWEALGDWHMADEYLEHVLSASSEDVRGAVAANLREDAAAVLVYRPAGTGAVAASARRMRALLGTVPFPVPAAAAPSAPVILPRARARFERAVAGVHVYRTERGVPILVRRRAGSAFAYLGVFAAGGSSADGHAAAGRTLLLCRTAVKGTATRPAEEIAEIAESLGGQIASKPGGDTLGWSLIVPRTSFDAAAALLADVVQHPALDAEKLEIERTAALSDLALLHDDMFAYPMRLAVRAAFGEHSYAAPVAGADDSLRAIARGELVSAHAGRVLSGDTVIGVVADADPHVLADTVAAAFNELTVGERPSISPPSWLSGARREEARQKAQTALTLAFPAPSRRDPDRFAMDLVAKIGSGLGGRFFEELRDRRSLAYTVHAFAAVRPLAGYFAAYIATSPGKEAEAHEGLLAEVGRLAHEPPADAELQRAQEYAVGTEIIRRESGSALLAEMLDAWLFGELEELERHEREIRAVTRDDVARVVGTYLTPEQAASGIVRGLNSHG